MSLLALDIATKTGWARWNAAAARPVYGVFTASGDLGEKVYAFRRFLVGAYHADGIRELLVEAPVPQSGNTNQDVLEHTIGLFAQAWGVASEFGVPFHAVNLGTWRKHFVGVARAPMTTPTGVKLTPHQRRKWIKQKTMDQCRERGWPVATDDAADALGLLDYWRSLHDRNYSLSNTPLWAEREAA